jgi:hypothetical protein
MTTTKTRGLVATTSVVAALLAGVSHSVAAGGGLALTPAIVEHTAVVGVVGRVTVANTSAVSMKVTVTPRPWRQARNGRVTPNRSLTLRKQVAVGPRTFTLAGGAKRLVVLRLLRHPSGGSLYGTVEAVGVPSARRAKHSGVVTIYRLSGSLRLVPTATRQTIRLSAGDVRITGSGARRTAVLAVRNHGNTIAPIDGTARIAGPHGSIHVKVGSVAALPGAVVDLALGRPRHFAEGDYTVSISLTQDGQPAGHTTRRLVVR